MKRSLLLRTVDYGNFTYADAGVANFAVNISGAVTPPTASEGKITDLDYSTGYSISPISGAFYPLVSESTARSVDVDVKAPTFPRYDNCGQIVEGTENTNQPAAPIFIYNDANVFGFAVNASGSVTPPTASLGTITTESYSPGYLTGSYPPVTSSIVRSVDLDIKVPQYYYNQFTEVSGSETAIQTPPGLAGVWTNKGTTNDKTDDSAGAGTNTAALKWGGNFLTGPGANGTTCTEEYNGTSWSSGGAFSRNIKDHAGTGTQNAGLSLGGRYSPAEYNCTDHYNGSSWSVESNFPQTSIDNATMAGTQNAAIAGFGVTTGPSLTSYEYNGTSWSAGANINAYRVQPNSGGTQNATIVGGGFDPSDASCCTEFYNGTSWSVGTASPTAVRGGGGGGQNAYIQYNGACSTPSVFGSSVEWNGTSWFTGGSMNNRVRNISSYSKAGTSAVGALSFAGEGQSPSSCYCTYVEEYNTAASYTWSSGPTSPLTVTQGGGTTAGTQAAFLMAGGTPTLTNGTEFNGASWSSIASLPTGHRNTAGSGTVSAALIFGGFPAPTGYTYEYNGASWSSRGLLIDATNDHSGAGVVNATIKVGGSGPTAQNCTEEFNGSTWSTGGTLNYCQQDGATTGTSNSALTFGGGCANVGSVCTSLYDGVSWSSVNSMNQARDEHVGFGTSNSAIAAGDSAGGNQCSTELWNGTSWSTVNPSLQKISNRQAGGASSMGIVSSGANTQFYNT